jgi:hypothetical protein
MTEVKCHEPRENNVKKVIQTMNQEKTSAANGTSSSEQSADTSRLSNIFNVLLKSRKPVKSSQEKLIDSEYAKRGLKKAEPLMKPSSSQAQHRFVEAKASEGEGWAKEWASKDKNVKSLPEKVKKSEDKTYPTKAIPDREPIGDKEPEYVEGESDKPVKFDWKNLKKAMPSNTGDKEKEKTEKPASHEKIMHCIKMAKQFKDPTVGYEAESNKVHADQQKKEKIGAVLGREPMKTTEPVKKSESNKINLGGHDYEYSHDNGVVSYHHVGDEGMKHHAEVSHSKKGFANQNTFNGDTVKHKQTLQEHADKILSEPMKKSSDIRISQTKTENGLKNLMKCMKGLKKNDLMEDTNQPMM